jgi:L-ornithine N5-oxygenase
MQIPDAKMQISFLKDLATPRNPQSAFTFLTYLFAQNRLNHFINLSTFTPSRCEYEDYLRWCAAHFERQGLVTYGQEVLKVLPATTSPSGKITSFRVISRSMQTGALTTRLARHVVVAVGGEGQLPAAFASGHAAIVHSSQYFSKVSTALPTPSAPYTIAVIGNGQSAAEIFNDLLSRYPNARIVLAIKGSALRPSDDSPFVNEIFDADRVDGVFAKPAPLRAKALLADRATNYGVVRLELIEHLYEKLYMQRLRTKAEDWKLAIKTHRRVVAAVPEGAKLRLEMQQVLDDGSEGEDREELTVDAVFVATGYVRNAHERMLEELAGLVPKEFRSEGKGGKFPVGRDYKVLLDGKRVDDSAGIWLQGCNEGTHGVCAASPFSRFLSFVPPFFSCTLPSPLPSPFFPTRLLNPTN